MFYVYEKQHSGRKDFDEINFESESMQRYEKLLRLSIYNFDFCKDWFFFFFFFFVRATL